jgi:hypothetical protein
MTVCRTLDEIWAQGAIDGAGDPPLTQAQADLVAAILAPHRARMAALETAPA